MPYLCKIFEMSGLRHARNFIREGYHTVTVINYPSCYTADELKSIFSHAPILNMSILPRKVLEKSSSWPEVQTRAEITFQSTVDAREACMLNGVKIRDTQLQVRPSDHQPAVAMPEASKSKSAAPKPPVTTDGEFEISTFTGNYTGKPTSNNNLYVSQLPKTVNGDGSQLAFRKVFARYGKIVSFKLVNKENFPCNVVYVAYKYPTQAQAALDQVSS